MSQIHRFANITNWSALGGFRGKLHFEWQEIKSISLKFILGCVRIIFVKCGLGEGWDYQKVVCSPEEGTGVGTNGGRNGCG